MTTAYAVAVGVADVRRDPDSTSELVTQALMNTPVVTGETTGEWTHVTLPDYEGWMHTNELDEPPVRDFCKVGKHCSTPLQLMALVTIPCTPLYAHAEEEETVGTVYLSTALPLRDTTGRERVQVALPGERMAWLSRSALDIREQESIYLLKSTGEITGYARLFLGVPYFWGGTTWEGIDCSGLVQLCYRMGGYMLPRDAYQQYDFLTQSIKREDMQEGDLVFFGTKSITHVAMALNNREYIHSEGQNYNRVLINSFDPAADTYYARLDQIVCGIKRISEGGTYAHPTI